MFQNRPHGGRLTNRVLEGRAREDWLERVHTLPRIQLNARQLSDVELIAVGAYSPLEGFLSQRDYESVLDHQRLAHGVVWTVPVTLAVGEQQAKSVGRADDLALMSADGQAIAILHLREVFRYDREREAQTVLQTTSEAHPGVVYLKSVGDFCLAGPISLLNRPNREEFARYTLDPKETRFLFAHRGWRAIAAFQTRNPVHRAHEYILRCALETVDGLLLHPLVGDTREEDVPAGVRLRCYLAWMQACCLERRV